MTSTTIFSRVALASLIFFGALAHGQEAQIRQNIVKRIPEFKTVDEVRKTAIPGLYEVRVNKTEIFYTDANGDYLINGQLFQTKTKRNLTEERISKLTEIKFDNLPFQDAFTIVRGNGQRKIAIFEDPNCGYCKRFERELQTVDNVTISLFLYPILGGDSPAKSQAIWCAKDKAQVWQDWMVREQALPPAAAPCDAAALKRNVEFGRLYKIEGTPTVILSNGRRIPGAVPARDLEQALAEVQN